MYDDDDDEEEEEEKSTKGANVPIFESGRLHPSSTSLQPRRRLRLESDDV